MSDERKFLLKINGAIHAPNRIPRPLQSSDWQGDVLRFEQKWKAPSTYPDSQPGPMIQTGDGLYIWCHEDAAHGKGRGLTATATVDHVQSDGAEISFRLRDVDILEQPFGFDALKGDIHSSALLRAMKADRRLRAWVVEPDQAAVLDNLITRIREQAQSARTLAADRHLDVWDRELGAETDLIKQAEQERQLTLNKARPGQQRFRDAAMARHGNCCVFSGCQVPEALDAAHVIPHTGSALLERDDNSLILRRDLHALFDAHLLAINPKTDQLVIATELTRTQYSELEGTVVYHQLAAQPLFYQFKQFNVRGDRHAKDGLA